MCSRLLTSAMACLGTATLLLSPAFAQGQGNGHAYGRGQIIVPDTSLVLPEDKGQRAHTNHLLHIHPFYTGTTPTGETPQSLRAVYGVPDNGGSGTIAIVIAYDYANALNDFNVFSRQFGLPVETSANVTASTNSVFQVVYATNGKRKPRGDAGWNQEAAMDIEWSHAMAPKAKIVLVEANSSSFSDLFAAVTTASNLPGVKQVSMSWGSNEFSSETAYDSYFKQPGVVYIASSGDNGGVMSYPAASPFVVAAGGTSVNRDSSGAFVSETGWDGSGGGVSAYEPRPDFQNIISGIVGSKRGVPDVSFDADPYTGASVYCSASYQGYSGWLVFGGTSLSAPALAGIFNTAGTAHGTFAASSQAQNAQMYSTLSDPLAFASSFYDVVGGTAGRFTAVGGWDFVTGIGSSRDLNNK